MSRPVAPSPPLPLPSKGRAAIWTRALSPFWLGLPLMALLARVLPSPRDSYPVYVAGLACINAILAVSLNIVNGFAGQFSLGHAGFMAVGGYVSALVTLGGSREPWLFPLALVLGGLAAGLAGLAVGVPSLRLKGDYLAIVTLGFGEIIRVVVENSQRLGGATGLSGLPALTTPFWILAVLLGTIVAASRLRRAGLGLAMAAVREDEVAAEAMGLPSTRVKVLAFAVSAFFAGMAGALLGHYLQILSPKDFTFVKSIEIVAMIVLGGLGSVSGAVIGALILTALPEALRPLQDYTGTDFRMVIYSALLIALMLARPQGLLGTREFKAWLRPGKEEA